MSGVIIPLKKPPPDSGDGIDEESEEEDHDLSSRGGSKSTWTNYSTKGVRNASKRDDSDSDFDL